MMELRMIQDTVQGGVLTVVLTKVRVPSDIRRIGSGDLISQENIREEPTPIDVSARELAPTLEAGLPMTEHVTAPGEALAAEERLLDTEAMVWTDSLSFNLNCLIIGVGIVRCIGIGKEHSAWALACFTSNVRCKRIFPEGLQLMLLDTYAEALR